MHRLHVYTIAGLALLVGTIVLIAQPLLLPGIPADAARQLTVIAQTERWESLQRAAIVAQPLVLMGLLAVASAITVRGARPWAWMGGGLSIAGVVITAVSHVFLGGPATATRAMVSESAPIDAALLTSYELMLPLASHAREVGWLSLGLGVALLGQGLVVARLSAPWMGTAVSFLGATGAVLALLLRDAARIHPAAIALLAAQLLLSLVLMSLSRSAADAERPSSPGSG